MQFPRSINPAKKCQSSTTKHLPEALQKLSEAKSYWQSSGTILVISAPPENIEHTAPLIDNYTISLVITSDAGEGTCYLIPPTQEL
ncbi:hypothetical protein [Bathymodiolus platifrons methanotrophic gill symbiont]|uniref:hypothetical protein n=1 Tax=Bathymodiolus platifrons methanotrophic gill symbiont TaxID=113268 RepID=UPI000B407FDD|nr:hypothetical protein [Bathymodiolus platifrons methanotrophic gill symbiont]